MDKSYPYFRELVRGKRDGYGLMFMSNGEVYAGQWAQDVRNGRGLQFYSSWGRYEGDFRFDMRSGWGMLVMRRRGTYFGQFLSNKKHGRGILIHPRGEVFAEWWNLGKLTRRLSLRDLLLYKKQSRELTNTSRLEKGSAGGGNKKEGTEEEGAEEEGTEEEGNKTSEVDKILDESKDRSSSYRRPNVLINVDHPQTTLPFGQTDSVIINQRTSVTPLISTDSSSAPVLQTLGWPNLKRRGVVNAVTRPFSEISHLVPIAEIGDSSSSENVFDKVPPDADENGELKAAAEENRHIRSSPSEAFASFDESSFDAKFIPQFSSVISTTASSSLQTPQQHTTSHYGSGAFSNGNQSSSYPQSSSYAQNSFCGRARSNSVMSAFVCAVGRREVERTESRNHELLSRYENESLNQQLERRTMTTCSSDSSYHQNQSQTSLISTGGEAGCYRQLSEPLDKRRHLRNDERSKSSPEISSLTRSQKEEGKDIHTSGNRTGQSGYYPRESGTEQRPGVGTLNKSGVEDLTSNGEIECDSTVFESNESQRCDEKIFQSDRGVMKIVNSSSLKDVQPQQKIELKIEQKIEQKMEERLITDSEINNERQYCQSISTKQDDCKDRQMRRISQSISSTISSMDDELLPELIKWTVEDVCEFLSCLGLPHLSPVFNRNQISGEGQATSR